MRVKFEFDQVRGTQREKQENTDAVTLRRKKKLSPVEEVTQRKKKKAESDRRADAVSLRRGIGEQCSQPLSSTDQQVSAVVQ
eukprot:1157553-Pelagomonas_calceolata.AAC.12